MNKNSDSNACRCTALATPILILLILAGTGCAFNKPTGALFEAKSGPSPGHSLIHFYRPSGESFGYDRTYFLVVNQQKVCDILHGGCFTQEFTSGKLSIVSDVNRSFRTEVLGVSPIAKIAELAANPQAARLDLQAAAGKTYYVKMHPDTSFSHFTPKLYLVPEETALKEIQRCRQITVK